MTEDGRDLPPQSDGNNNLPAKRGIAELVGDDPDLRDRLMRMVENRQQHLMEREKKADGRNFLLAVLGLLLTVFVCLAFVGVAIAGMEKGHPYAAMLVGAVGVVGIGVMSLISRRK